MEASKPLPFSVLIKYFPGVSQSLPCVRLQERRKHSEPDACPGMAWALQGPCGRWERKGLPRGETRACLHRASASRLGGPGLAVPAAQGPGRRGRLCVSRRLTRRRRGHHASSPRGPTLPQPLPERPDDLGKDPCDPGRCVCGLPERRPEPLGCDRTGHSIGQPERRSRPWRDRLFPDSRFNKSFL